MSHRLPLVVSVLCAALSLGGCASTGDAKMKEQSWDAQRLYDESRNALKRGDAAGAVRHLESLQVRFPLDDFAKQAQLDIILAYFQREEFDYAITSADHFIQLNPQSPHAAYAWYMKGRSEVARTRGLFERFQPRNLADTDQRLIFTARQYFDTVSKKYPDSPWAEESAHRSAELLEELAEHELNTAQFYFERGAYVGAINRATLLLQRFPDSQHSGAAQSLLAAAYEKQGLMAQAQSVSQAR